MAFFIVNNCRSRLCNFSKVSAKNFSRFGSKHSDMAPPSPPFVPVDFIAPTTFAGPGFYLEPLAAKHNERDHEAWSSSMEHIHKTPGMEGRDWPHDMTLAENLADMEMHWNEFHQRTAFTYSILDKDDQVIGCVYIYPDTETDADAHVRSWVRQSRAEMDRVVWQSISEWLLTEWPFTKLRYKERA